MALRKAATSEANRGREPTGDPDDTGEDAYARKLAENLEAVEAAKAEPDDTTLLGVLSKEYLDFSNMVAGRTPTVLRDLFAVKKSAEPVPPAEVQEALDIVRHHFRGAALSHGALTRDSH